MTSPILQVKRGALSNLPGLRAGEPAFTTDTYDFFVGIDSTTNNNKFVGSHRYWTKETSTTGSGVRFVERTDGGSNYIEVKAPNTAIGSNVTYVLPSVQGSSSTVLTNDGSGNLSWSSGSTNATFTGITTFSDTTDNTLGDPDTGAVQIDGGLGVNKNVTIGDSLDIEGHLNVVGVSTFGNEAKFNNVITPATGDSAAAGIIWPSDPGGGTGDVAYIKYYVESGENTRLEISNQNDADDDIYLNTNEVVVSNNLHILGTTDSTNYNDGAVIIDGGLGVEASVNIGGNLYVTGVSTFNGLEIGNNGISVAGFSTIYELQVLSDFGVGGTATIDGVLLADNDVRVLGISSFTNTTDSTNYDNGAIVTDGGLGVEKSVNIGKNLNVSGISTLNTLNVNGTATFNGTLVGTISTATYAVNAGISTQVKVGSASNNNATYYLTFVNNNNGSPTASNVYTDDAVYYNPGTNTFTTQYGLFTGSVEIQNGLNVSGGITTVGTLSVSGPATFTNTVTGTISTATRATSVDVAGVAVNQDYYITLVDASGNAKSVGVDAELLYNPNTNKMKVPTINVGTLNASDGTNAINISNTTGAVGFANSVTVNGDLYVIGTTTQVETTNLKVQDNLIDLGLTQSNGVLVPPGSDLNIDLGILMNWYNGSAKKAAVYWHDNTQRLTLASDVTEAAGVLTANAYADIEIGSLWVNDCAGQSQVISCSGSERFLNNITVDAGQF